MRTPIGLPLSCDDDRVRAASAQCRKDLVELLVSVDRGERRLHRGGDVLVQRVGVLEHAVEEVAILERADHVRERVELPVAHHRELRDPVLLHEVDRLADLLVRRDRDQVRHLRLLGLLRAQHLFDRRRRRVALEEPEVEHVVVVVELREVRAAAVGNQGDDGLALAELLAISIAAWTAVPPEPPISRPSSRAMRLAVMNESLSVTVTHWSTISRSNVSG